MIGTEGFRFVPYARHHREAVLELLGGWGIRRSLWEWQFESRGPFEPLVVEDAAGRVAGYNGYLPVTARIAGRMTQGIWSCDFAVRADCRGKGIGRAIKQRLQARHALVLALGISEAAARVHNRVGWSAPHGVAVHTLLREARTVKERTKIVAQKAMSLAAAGASPRRRRGDLQVEVRSAKELPSPEADQLWQSAESGYDNVVARDATYLRWRYAGHPLVDYRLILVTRNRQLAGIGVFWCASPRAALVDYVGAFHASDVKQAIVDRFTQESATARWLTCTTSDPELHRCLQRHGFLTWSSRPLRFSVHCPDMLAGTHDAAWFLMGGDSDGDVLASASAALQSPAFCSQETSAG